MGGGDVGSGGRCGEQGAMRGAGGDVGSGGPVRRWHGCWSLTDAGSSSAPCLNGVQFLPCQSSPFLHGQGAIPTGGCHRKAVLSCAWGLHAGLSVGMTPRNDLGPSVARSGVGSPGAVMAGLGRARVHSGVPASPRRSFPCAPSPRAGRSSSGPAGRRALKPPLRTRGQEFARFKLVL